MNKRILVGGISAAVLLAAFMTGCSSDSSASPPPSAQQLESQAQQQDSNNLVTNQPVHVYNYSQMRATLQNVEDIEAQGENTTTFFFNQGIQNPISSCASIGMPVASSDQLTNPDQQVAQPDGGGYQLNQGDNVIGQMDPTGVYTGDSTGTNVLCLNSKGQEYIQYWEGFVDAVSGAATWNENTHQVQLLGFPDTLKEKPATSK
jgi:hypothetical protein